MPRLPAEILLVAGPSGAGKSTFIRCLKAGTLSSDIANVLFPSSAEWRVVEANDFLKRSVAIDPVVHEAAQAGGIILHFDTAFGRRFGVMDYARDPAFSLMQQATSVVVVSIEPSPTALQVQFEGRLGEQRRRRGWARELWRRAVRRPASVAIQIISRRRNVDTSRIYRSPDELERCYREWATFARTLVKQRPGSKFICVEPLADRDHGPGFVAKPDRVEI